MFKTYYQALLILLFTSVSSLVFSQNVGINITGTTASTNAILDLNTGNSRNLGLIIPNVTLGTSLSSFWTGSVPPGPIVGLNSVKDVGMIVYNAGANQPMGYYYWSGASWVPVGSGASGNVTACVSAAAGYVPYYTSANEICNSVIFQSATPTVGVGTIIPKNMLDVNGAMAVGSGTNIAGNHYAGGSTAPANGMIIEGQVGIGTNVPP